MPGANDFLRIVWEVRHNEFNLRAAKNCKERRKKCDFPLDVCCCCCFCWANYLPILSDNLFQHLLLKFVSLERWIYTRQAPHTQRHTQTGRNMNAHTCKITGKLIFLTLASALAQSQAQLCAKFIAQLMFGPRIKCAQVLHKLCFDVTLSPCFSLFLFPPLSISLSLIKFQLHFAKIRMQSAHFRPD